MARVLVNTVSLSSGALTRERHLLCALAALDHPHEVHVLCTPETASRLSFPDGFVRHEVSRPAGTTGRITWENTGLLQRVRRLDPDLLYFPLHITNLVDLCPKVSAVRNAAPFCPGVIEQASRRERLRLRALRLATRRTVAQSDTVVFMSETTLETVASYVPAAREKGVVIPHGVPDGFEPTAPTSSLLDAYGVPDSFLLTVSNIARYKNLVELVDGYAQARERAALPPLCIAGKTVSERYEREVRNRIAQHGLEDDVRLLGFVDHADLPGLYAGSDLFVFPSTCENAPMTVIEALACGATVATSEAASMPELCGEAAAYFDPEDPAAIAATLLNLWNDPERRERLSQAALDRATKFSWTDAARETSKVFERVGTDEQV